MFDPAHLKSLSMRNLHVLHEIPGKAPYPFLYNTADCVSGVCQQHTKNQLKGSLQAQTKLSETEVEDVLKTLDDPDLHTPCSSALSTTYKRKQYFEENFPYVHPQSISWGVDENRKEHYAQYIPIRNTLTALLKDPTVWEECSRSGNDSTPIILNDVCDGSVFKLNALFSESGLTLKAILYQDTFEVVNPLGSAKKTHKMLGVYFTLANFDPFHRPLLTTCSFCFCAKKLISNILAMRKCPLQWSLI